MLSSWIIRLCVTVLPVFAAAFGPILNSALAISSPGTNSVVQSGEIYLIQWLPSPVIPEVDLILRSGNPYNLDTEYTIARSIPDSGSFIWHVPPQPNAISDVSIMIHDSRDPLIVNYSPFFTIEAVNARDHYGSDIDKSQPKNEENRGTSSEQYAPVIHTGFPRGTQTDPAITKPTNTAARPTDDLSSSPKYNSGHRTETLRFRIKEHRHPSGVVIDNVKLDSTDSKKNSWLNIIGKPVNAKKPSSMKETDAHIRTNSTLVDHDDNQGESLDKKHKKPKMDDSIGTPTPNSAAPSLTGGLLWVALTLCVLI